MNIEIASNSTAASPTAAPAQPIVFVTLEDETDCVNVIVWRDPGERQRRERLSAPVGARKACARPR